MFSPSGTTSTGENQICTVNKLSLPSAFSSLSQGELDKQMQGYRKPEIQFGNKIFYHLDTLTE